MKFLSTLLVAMAVCAALLAGVAYRVGDLPEVSPRTGLTAATVLGIDPVQAAGERAGPDELDHSASSERVGDGARTSRVMTGSDRSQG
ncbi:hypothetical protein ACRAWG_09145 [Methylobacterium sp. P31]